MLRGALTACLASGLLAQLPPDAVDLGKVQIAEKIGSVDFCPVHLVASDAAHPSWTHAGLSYRGHAAACEKEFDQAPDRFAAAAAKHRWIRNFLAQMSRVWCPVTDEITPGGLLEWHGLGYTWESCCAFCDVNYDEGDLPIALERLKQRAAESYQLTGGRYVEGAASPIAGAIKGLGPAPTASDAAPDYLAGVELQPTYTGGVGLIFEHRCLECHHPGGASPVDFTSYGAIRRWTKSMRTAIETGDMPPAPPDPDVGELANGRRLSGQERDVLIAWAEAGFPRGDGDYQPRKRWNPDWNIGEPDHVFPLPDHTVGENVTGEFREFVIETDFPEDRWIVAAEARPGDEFLVYGIDGGPLGTYRPGNLHEQLPAGTGYLLKAGALVTMRVHYAEKETGYELEDSGSRLGVRFAEKPDGLRAVETARMPAPAFEIPAGAADFAVEAKFTLPVDAELVSLMPVMMRRGKSVRYDAILPDGERRALLSISRWHPERKYRYALVPVPVPAGTVVVATARFDNSAANPNNPDATKAIGSGAAGEIFEGWVGYVSK